MTRINQHKLADEISIISKLDVINKCVNNSQFLISGVLVFAGIGLIFLTERRIFFTGWYGAGLDLC